MNVRTGCVCSEIVCIRKTEIYRNLFAVIYRLGKEVVCISRKNKLVLFRCGKGKVKYTGQGKYRYVENENGYDKNRGENTGCRSLVIKKPIDLSFEFIHLLRHLLVITATIVNTNREIEEYERN